MPDDFNPQLAAVQAAVGEAMNDILQHFKPGVNITVMVRTPGYPHQDFLMTDDNLAEVAFMIHRRMEEGQA